MNFSRQHMLEVAKIAELIDISKIEEMIDILVQVKKSGGRLFILGVGGSAGNASHAVNDFRKLVGIEAYAPTDNVSEVTARTNDEGFDTIFTAFLSVSRLSTNDCLLILSVGGGDVERAISKNICSAIDFSKSQNETLLFRGGSIKGYYPKRG